VRRRGLLPRPKLPQYLVQQAALVGEGTPFAGMPRGVTERPARCAGRGLRP